MTRAFAPYLALLAALLFAACSEPAHENEHGHEDGHDTHGTGPNGGMIADIGDHEAHLEVIIDHDKQAVIAHVLTEKNAVLRIKDAPILNLNFKDGPKQITGKAVDANADGASEWHFRDSALAGEPEGGRFRIQWNGKTYQVALEHDHDHAHEHDGDGHDDDHAHERGDEDHGHGPHDGELAHLHNADGDEVGRVELKLHGDKGDLELWLTDEDGDEAFDLPADTKIQVVFSSHGDKSVSLAVRNREKNEDEDGTATMRSGKTNYFIFPGETGADAKWLMGEDFEGEVKVIVKTAGGTYHTDAFDLEPHVEDGDHDHD